MSAAVRVATFPFRVVWRLVSLLFLPVLVGTVTWLLAGTSSGWSVVLLLACAAWALVMVRLWWTQVTGELRSLARGTVQVSTSGRRGKRARRVRGGRK